MWEQSRLDPCLFFLREQNPTLVGILVIHVDDVLIGGTGPTFEEAVKELRTASPFRKWMVGLGEYCGAVLAQDDSFDVTCSQDKAYGEVCPANLRRKARGS